MGSNTGLRRARRSTHSSSAHWYWLTVTRDAVCGGTSVAKANGSARSVTTPSAPYTRNLYNPSTGNPGQNSSHTPDEPSTRMGASVPVQPLNSPIRLTPLAFGAHTANDTPLTTPSAVVNERGWAPSTSQ